MTLLPFSRRAVVVMLITVVVSLWVSARQSSGKTQIDWTGYSILLSEIKKPPYKNLDECVRNSLKAGDWSPLASPHTQISPFLVGYRWRLAMDSKNQGGYNDDDMKAVGELEILTGEFAPAFCVPAVVGTFRGQTNWRRVNPHTFCQVVNGQGMYAFNTTITGTAGPPGFFLTFHTVRGIFAVPQQDPPSPHFTWARCSDGVDLEADVFFASLLDRICLAGDSCAWRIRTFVSILAPCRDLGRIVQCAIWPSFFCICWRQSPGSPVPAAPVPWWPNPCSSSTSC